MADQKKIGSGLPLDGVTVVDFSRLLPGPWCTQMLGEFGANVIKVEQPGVGDYSRYNAPRYRKDGVYFNAVNGDKRSLTLDLTKPEGLEVAHRLIKKADVVVESFRPGVTKKLKIDYDTAKAMNPGVIYCAISGFGQTGPHANIAGHDLVIQGMAGILGGQLEPGQLPGNPGFQTGDYAGALYATIGILAAVLQRQNTGKGVFLDMSMFDAVFHMCPVVLTSALAKLAGHSGEPKQESFGKNPRYANYLTKDRKVVSVALLEPKAWQEFAKMVGRDDLIYDKETWEDRHTTHGSREDLYRQALTEYCGSKTLAEHERILLDTGIAICPLYEPEQALDTENVKARGLVNFIDSPAEGRIPHLVNPIARSGVGIPEHRPAPSLGQHTDEVLAEFGYSAAEIAKLRAANAV